MKMMSNSRTEENYDEESFDEVTTRSRSSVGGRKSTATATARSTDKNAAGLSSDELKMRLMQTVKNKGIYDSVKSQLRKKLALELNTNIERVKSKASEVSKSRAKSNLALNTINSLIIDHLKTNEYDYTLSVFMPECGINLNEVYSLNDILHVLKVSPSSKLYDEIESSSVIKTKGLMWYLINYLCRHYVTSDAAVQTDFDGIHSITSNLDHKLKNLDKHYQQMGENLDGRLSFEEKIIAYQKKLEEKARIELEQKLDEYKQVELVKMRLEEREKQRAELQAFRRELELQYKKRHDELKDREKTGEELLKHRRELEDREMFNQRQKLLDELKQLHEKEAEYKRTLDAHAKTAQSDASRYDKLEEELKRREARLRQAESDLEARLRDERERMKLDVERSFSQREFILQSIEAKNMQEATQLQVEKSHFEKLKHEFQLQQIRLNELDLEIQKARGESACIQQENQLLKEHMDRTLDYDFLKKENQFLRQKLDISKELIGERQLTGRSRSNILTNRPPPIPSTRRRSVTFQENDANPNQASGQQQQVPALDLDEMLPTEAGVDDEVLRATYREEGERILNEAVERSELKDQLEHHDLVNEELRDLYEMQIFEQRKLNDTVNEVKKQVDLLYYGVCADDMDSVGILSRKKPAFAAVETSEINVDFLQGARDRLKYLESENDRIDHAFRDYQHKIKSKYYPINDDEDKEWRIVEKNKHHSQHDPLDVEKFLEMTMKATVHARQMREDLESDLNKHSKPQGEVKISDERRLLNERKLDELIASVPMSKFVPTDPVDESIENARVKDRLLKEENEFRLFDETVGRNLKSFNLINSNMSDTSGRSPPPKQLSKRQELVESEREVKDRTLDEITDDESKSKSKSPTRPATTSTGGAAINDYLNLFNKQPNGTTRSESEKKKSDDEDSGSIRVEPKRKIKIEYSSSSSSSDKKSQSETSSDDDKPLKPSAASKKVEFNSNKKQSGNNDDDDDDDFNW